MVAPGEVAGQAEDGIVQRSGVPKTVHRLVLGVVEDSPGDAQSGTATLVTLLPTEDIFCGLLGSGGCLERGAQRPGEARARDRGQTVGVGDHGDVGHGGRASRADVEGRGQLDRDPRQETKGMGVHGSVLLAGQFSEDEVGGGMDAPRPEAREIPGLDDPESLGSGDEVVLRPSG